MTVANPLAALPSVIHAFGHSYTAGAMSNASSNRQTAKLAALCKGTEINKGVGTSILCSQNTIAGTLDTNSSPSGIVGVLQTLPVARTIGTDQFLSPVQCAVLCWGINDWAMMGSAQFAVSFPAMLHTAIRRIRAGAVFEDSDATVTYPTGAFSLGAGTTANSGAGNHSSTATSATVQIAVPSQYQGQAITIGALDVAQATTMVVTDEGSVNRGSLTLGNFGFTQTQRRNGYPSIYIPAGTLSSGAHTLTVTYTQAGANPMFFDYWSIESNPTPLILIELANRIPDYTKHAVGWPNAPLNDAAITSMNTIMQTVASSYTDGRVVCVAMDDLTANLASNLTIDGVHPQSGPAGSFAGRCQRAIHITNGSRVDLSQLGTV